MTPEVYTPDRRWGRGKGRTNKSKMERGNGVRSTRGVRGIVNEKGHQNTELGPPASTSIHFFHCKGVKLNRKHTYTDLLCSFNSHCPPTSTLFRIDEMTTPGSILQDCPSIKKDHVQSCLETRQHHANFCLTEPKCTGTHREGKNVFKSQLNPMMR